VIAKAVGLLKNGSMSASHLHILHSTLVQRGWKVKAHETGDDVIGAATWTIVRNPKQRELKIDFHGFGSMGEDISLDESHGCQVRGLPIHLYFSRVNRSRDRWLVELAEFVDALDSV
jgi:hypothetical protein